MTATFSSPIPSTSLVCLIHNKGSVNPPTFLKKKKKITTITESISTSTSTIPIHSCEIRVRYEVGGIIVYRIPNQANELLQLESKEIKPKHKLRFD